MDLSSQIQIIHIPPWLRAIVVLIVFGLSGVCAYLFYNALAFDDRVDWIAAGAYLAGVVFPILVLLLLFVGSSFGEYSIHKKTDLLLTQTVPYVLRFFPEEPQEFATYRSGYEGRSASKSDMATVSISHVKNRCYADYKIVDPTASGRRLEMLIRVEVNIRRANVNIVFDRKRLEKVARDRDISYVSLSELISLLFPHSFSVEEVHRTDPSAVSEKNAGVQTHYRFNPNLFRRETMGPDMVALVASTKTSSDLIWNPAERLYFSQDLLFMLRAFAQECPECFSEEAAGELGADHRGR